MRIQTIAGILLLTFMGSLGMADETPVCAKKTTRVEGGPETREISIPSVSGAPAIKGALVVPKGGSKTAGILWVHWLGEPSTTNHTEFLDEAISMAGKGVTSLLVDAMWSKPKWYGSRIPEEDHDHALRQIDELRRSLDFLLAQPGVDSTRIAIVAHDYGGMFASLMLGADHRAKACVLIAVTPDLMDWAFYGPKPKDEAGYRTQHQDLDIPKALSKTQGTRFFLQFAKEDFYVPEPKAQAYIAATPEPKTWKIYEGAGHDMTKPASIRKDRQAWLDQVLNLSSSSQTKP